MSTDQQRAVERVHRRLAERAAEQTSHLWVLIDRLHPSAIDHQQLAARCRPMADIKLTHPTYIRPGTCPLLVHLAAQDADLIRHTVQSAFDEQRDPDQEAVAGFAVGGWIFSNQWGPALAKHIAWRMQRAGQQQDGRLVRWHDRRVLEWGFRHLDEMQQRYFLSGIDVWATLSRCGELIEHVAAPLNESGVPRMGLSMTNPQWDTLNQCALIQDILRSWCRINPALPTDYLNNAARAAAEGVALGLADRSDLVLLAAYIHQLHPRLARHPDVCRRVRGSVATGTPLAIELARIEDPAGWDRIRNDLLSSTRTSAAQAVHRMEMR